MKPMAELDMFILECLAIYMLLRSLMFARDDLRVFYNDETKEVGILAQRGQRTVTIKVDERCRHLPMDRFLGEWKEFACALEEHKIPDVEVVKIWERCKTRERSNDIVQFLIREKMMFDSAPAVLSAVKQQT